jgi:Domain of unknown function (DUF1906)
VERVTTVVDYSFARPGGGAIAAAGHAGVVRYLAPINAQTRAKLLTPDEVADLRSHGLSIAMVWEGGSSRALAGTPAGIGDAAEANRQANVLGAPPDAAIYYAVDFDADPSAIAAYFQGVTITRRRPVGVYGSWKVVEAILASGLAILGWQTSAWSAGRRSAQAALFQRPGASNVPGTDINDCQRDDWGQWPRPATAKEDDMPAAVLVNLEGQPEIWCVGPAGRWYVGHPKSVDLLGFTGVANPNVVTLHLGDGGADALRGIPIVTPTPIDVSALADAIVARLPAGSPVDAQALAAAVVSELGSELRAKPTG